MSTQFAEFLAAHAGRVAELCRRQTGSSPRAAAAIHRSREFVSAVLVALTAEDHRPLLALYQLETLPGLEERLDTAVAELLALARASDEVAREQQLSSGAAHSLALSAGEELGGLVRQLTSTAMALMRSRLNTATSASSARGSSLNITMHELRRPLTIMSSYAQLLSSGMLGALPESASVAIEGVSSSTEQMVRMVNALAELGRLEDPDDELTLEELEAADIVTAAVEQLATEADLRGVHVDASTSPGIRVRGERRRLVLALVNLLSNGIKHSSGGAHVEVSAFSDDASAHLLVRDHGPGFADEDASHLFEKYFRSVSERQRKVPGSGLGLYIVRSVAERHGGGVAARNVAGNGAEFEMIVPLLGTED
ncbi:MAG: sensor histidine kinase [Candidatus Dormibacteria bacterium]